MDKQTLVKEWMLLFGQAVPSETKLPSSDVKALRVRLIQEELLELEEAFLLDSLRDAADALADLLYVVYGTAVACGIGPTKMDQIFQAVHANNMQKLWTTSQLERQLELACGALDGHLFVQYMNITARRVTLASLWKVTDAGGKVIKPMGFEKVEIEI